MTTIESHVLAQDMAKMACELRRPMPLSRSGSKARMVIQRRFDQMLEQALDSGVAYGLYDGNRFIGSYVRYQDQKFGPKVQNIFVGHYPGHKLGIEALADLLKQERKYFHRRTFLFLPPMATDLIPIGLEYGFSICGIVLSGTQARAAKGLRGIAPPVKLSALGLRRKRISTEEEIDQAIKIQIREFTRNPQFGWFLTTREFNEMIRKQFKEQISTRSHPTKTWVLIDKNEKVWGFYSMFTNLNSPLWGASAGLGIILHEKFQRRGIVKNIYVHLINEMKRSGIRHFMGGTAQPAVMGLAKVMGRQVFTTEMQFGKGYFQPDHFGH